MADTLAPLDTHPGVNGIGKKDLLSELDGLLERYLNTLDDYQKTRQQLSSLWSSVSTKGVSRYVRNYADFVFWPTCP
jgi:hypothetical protein